MKFFNFFKKKTRPVVVFVPGVNSTSEGAYKLLSKELSGFDFVFHDTGSWFKKSFVSLEESAMSLSELVNGLKGRDVVLVGWSYGALVVNHALVSISKDVRKVFFINSVISYKQLSQKKDYLRMGFDLNTLPNFLKALKKIGPERGRKYSVKNISKHFLEYTKDVSSLNVLKSKVIMIGSSDDIFIPLKLVSKCADFFGCEFYAMPGTHISLIEYPKELGLIIRNNI